VFVRSDREELVSERGIEGPPDLVVEVVSPSTEARDRGIKLERYRHFGVREYWIVDADRRTVEVWRGSADAGSPEVLCPDDRLDWTPTAEAPTLHVPVGAVFEGVA
jgi:Uma2 family endonuclease